MQEHSDPDANYILENLNGLPVGDGDHYIDIDVDTKNGAVNAEGEVDGSAIRVPISLADMLLDKYPESKVFAERVSPVKGVERGDENTSLIPAKSKAWKEFLSGKISGITGSSITATITLGRDGIVRYSGFSGEKAETPYVPGQAVLPLLVQYIASGKGITTGKQVSSAMSKLKPDDLKKSPLHASLIAVVWSDMVGGLLQYRSQVVITVGPGAAAKESDSVLASYGDNVDSDGVLLKGLYSSIVKSASRSGGIDSETVSAMIKDVAQSKLPVPDVYLADTSESGSQVRLVYGMGNKGFVLSKPELVGIYDRKGMRVTNASGLASARSKEFDKGFASMLNVSDVSVADMEEAANKPGSPMVFVPGEFAHQYGVSSHGQKYVCIVDAVVVGRDKLLPAVFGTDTYSRAYSGGVVSITGHHDRGGVSVPKPYPGKSVNTISAVLATDPGIVEHLKNTDRIKGWEDFAGAMGDHPNVDARCVNSKGPASELTIAHIRGFFISYDYKITGSDESYVYAVKAAASSVGKYSDKYIPELSELNHVRIPNHSSIYSAGSAPNAGADNLVRDMAVPKSTAPAEWNAFCDSVREKLDNIYSASAE